MKLNRKLTSIDDKCYDTIDVRDKRKDIIITTSELWDETQLTKCRSSNLVQDVIKPIELNMIVSDPLFLCASLLLQRLHVKTFIIRLP